jgi:hypothetical protein
MLTRLLFPAVVAALLLIRLPSLTQPLGPDQGIYAYIGDRILHGELAYRDAWDQKPPGIHYVYAALRAVSKSDAMVPASELVAAALVALLAALIAGRLGGRIAAWLTAILYLLLADPSLDRYGGVRIRGQAETFIALAITGAVLLAASGRRPPRLRLFAAGLLVGVAFTLKYNAAIYFVPVLAAAVLTGGLAPIDAGAAAIGAAIVPLAMLAVFWRGGALGDLYQATIVYNLRYSAETYASRLDMLRYLATFPVHHARISGLWFLGGLGTLTLVVTGFRRRVLWMPVVWVAAACVSIAINGGRELPQYFVQAGPALAVAAGLGLVTALGTAPVIARWAVAVALAYGCWRVGTEPFPVKLARNVWSDTRYAAHTVDRRTNLARFGGRDTDKYSALDNVDIGWFLAQHTRADEAIYVFGFSPGSYAYAGRRSASRFFWSRPVILGFDEENPRYGVTGLHDDLERNRPAYVVLQQHDWSPDVQDSAPFFLSQPPLAGWLHANYHEVRPFVDGFLAWERNGR